MAITLKAEIAEQLLVSLQRYCAKNFDEEVGQLKARLLLDFCLREIGPAIYNEAIRDAQAEMREKVDEIDVNCHKMEFAYWKK